MSDRRAPGRAAPLALLALALGGLAALAQDGTPGNGALPAADPFLGEAVDAGTLHLGRELYAANCATCHGADLEGQPDWKRRGENGRMPAPPHDATGHTWHHSDGQLLAITRDSLEAILPGYESDMPAFGGTLADHEIRAVLAYIRSTWPEREQAFQAEVTRNAAPESDGP